MMQCIAKILPACSGIIKNDKVWGMFLSLHIPQVVRPVSEPYVSVWVKFHVAGEINTGTVVSAEGLITQNIVKPIHSMQYAPGYHKLCLRVWRLGYQSRYKTGVEPVYFMSPTRQRLPVTTTLVVQMSRMSKCVSWDYKYKLSGIIFCVLTLSVTDYTTLMAEWLVSWKVFGRKW
jgi:hypothetical protein